MAARRRTTSKKVRVKRARSSASSSRRPSAARSSSSNNTSNQNMFILAVALIVAIAGYMFLRAQANQSFPAPEVMVREAALTLVEQNKSGQTGSAKVTEKDGKVMVAVEVTSGKAGVSQPAHLHLGTCVKPGEVVYPLTSVVDGKSETTLDVSYDDFKAKLPLVLNVHKSVAQSGVYVACGELSAAAY